MPYFSRLILFSRGYQRAHTDDHTEAYEGHFDRNKNAAADYNELRFMVDSHKLSRALGDSENCTVQFYDPVPLQKEDSFLICTECFWRYLSVIEMELDYRKAAGPEEWLKIMARRVLMRANQELDEQNFAAIAAMVE